MLRDILATNVWSVTMSRLFFSVISSEKCHWLSHDKFHLKQNNVSVTSSTVMITGVTQTVGATITCFVTFWATNSWSVTCSRHFQSVIIPLVMGDMRCVRVVQRNKMSMVYRSVGPVRPSNQTERDSILLLGTSRQIHSKNVVIITDRKCHSRDQVSDLEWGAKQNVIKHVINPPTVWVLPPIVSVVYVS